jgi:hypothetical protein
VAGIALESFRHNAAGAELRLAVERRSPAWLKCFGLQSFDLLASMAIHTRIGVITRHSAGERGSKLPLNQNLPEALSLANCTEISGARASNCTPIVARYRACP